LLGDVYGDHSDDAVPVRREPAAAERSVSDYDLTAALSAALNTEPAPAPVAAAPVVDLPAAEAPKVSGWASDPSAMPAMPSSMSVTAPVPAMAGRMWNPGDDDIFPGVKGGKKKK
jgi:hypothetical protein